MDDNSNSIIKEEFLHFLSPFLLDQNAKLYSIIYKDKNAQNLLFNFALKSKDIDILKNILEKKSKKELTQMLLNAVIEENIFLVKIILQSVKYDSNKINIHLSLNLAILLKNRSIIEHLLICEEPKGINKEYLKYNSCFEDLLPYEKEFCSLM